MEEETLKIINEKIRKLLGDSEDSISFDKALGLIKALNNPLNRE